MFDESQDLIERELARDERLLWSGRPPQGLMLRPIDALLIPFSLLWGGFVMFWEFSAFAMGAPLIFKLWGVPFVLVGLYLVAGRFWFDARLRANTVYGVTNERVVLSRNYFGRRTRSLDINALPELSLRERSDGGGSITFQASPYWMNPGVGWPGMGYAAPFCFELERNARQVFDLIRDAQRISRRSERTSK